MSSSCCAGKCGCGSGCKCGSSCGGCKMYPDTISGENTTTETLILGVTPNNTSIMGCVAVGVKPEVQRRPARMEDASAVHAHVSHATANEEDDQSPMAMGILF
uniref:Metallothionein-like protein n=1 Tax=Lactuca sativa TaxID=4236 RepID=A0A9R1WTX2_LACSA|nr:hypothetical protein LSAT_V11C900502040 [Lactuca sativa]